MKKTLLIGLAATSLLIVGLPAAHADDLDPLVSTQKEEGLEADHDTMQIHDLEAEQKNAKEQAQVQEQISRDAKARLENVEVKKSETAAQASEEIAVYETRRKEAERENKVYTEKINKLSADIKKLDDSMAKAKQAAKDAEDIAAAGREELQIVEDHKTKLDNENRQAVYLQAQAEEQVAQLRAQYQQISATVKDLETRLQMNQAETQKKMTLKAQYARQLAIVQAKNARLRSALGMKPLTPVVAGVSKPDTKTAKAARQPATPPTPMTAVPAPPAAPVPAAPAAVSAPAGTSAAVQPPPPQIAMVPRAAAATRSMAADGSMPAGPEVQTVKTDGQSCDPVLDTSCPKH